MTTWCYRIVRKKIVDGEYYGVYEAYYEDGNLTMVTLESIAPYGDTLEELTMDLAYMLEALKKPVLNYEDIP